MPEDPDPPSRPRLIATALEALGRDLDGSAGEDPSRDAELRLRLQDFADLFLAEERVAPKDV